MRTVRIALVAVGALALASCEPTAEADTAPAAPPPPPEVTVAKPVVRPIVEDDEFVGRFDAVDTVDVRARVGGYLDAVQFTDGQMVVADEPLFTIDQRPFAAELDRAKAQMEVTQTLLDYAKSQFERGADLVRRGTIPQSQYDQRNQEYLSAQASFEAAKAAVTTAELNYGYTEIKAPIAGRIGRKLVSEGNLVTADQTVLTTIVSQNPIYFYFDIDERSLLTYQRDARERGSTLQEGAGALPVKVRLADELGSFDGVLDFADNRVDQASGTIRLRARFDNTDSLFQPGMFGRINVPASLPHEGVMLPDEAISSDQNRRIVYVVGDDGTVSAKPVRPGPRIDGYRVIRTGLDGSETVVINGLMRVRPGSKVTPKLVELPPVAATEG